MAFDIITFLRRLGYIVLALIFVVILIIVSAVIGSYFGPVWGFVAYMSPAIFAFLYLMGLKS